MKIIFRCDASVHIGTGHVMRCLALASQLKQEGISSHFICREHLGHLANKILNEGFSVSLLPLQKIMHNRGMASTSIYSEWLGADWECDASDVAAEALRSVTDWVIVDHYAVDFKWEAFVRDKTGAKIMLINGLANKKHLCDLLLDPTYSQNDLTRWDGLLPGECQLLCGPNYSPFRGEFILEHQNARQDRSEIKRIFVSFGGLDEFNVTLMVVDGLIELDMQHIKVDIVVGANNPHITLLQEKYLRINNVRVYVQPDNVAKLMANADLAISGGGVMVLEQCFLGVPTIVISVAENQIRAAKQLHDAGAIFYLGHFNSISKDLIKSALLKFIGDIVVLNKMSRVAQGIMAKPELTVAQILKGSI